MTVQYSTTLRSAIAGVKETTIGTSPKIRLYDGVKPANCAAPLSGNTLLASGTLPSDWLADPSNGAVSKQGTWQLTGQVGAGTGTVATFYRIYDSGDTVCHEQGTVSGPGDGGDMIMDNPNIANGQVALFSAYTTTAGNA